MFNVNKYKQYKNKWGSILKREEKIAINAKL